MTSFPENPPAGRPGRACLRRALGLLLLLALGAWGIAPAARAEGGLPVIKAHSQTEFAVYKGDIVSVEVKAKGGDLQYKWVQAKDTFCREASCDIDTSDWGLGSHKIAFVVFNSKGSLYLKFLVKVLATPAGYKPGKVKPDVEDVREDIESVTNVDLAVRTLTGRGFSFHKKKLQVVGPTPRTLDWGEKLRTQEESTMQILREGKEHHVLGPATSVALAKSETGHRVLVLNKGMLRSRQLDGKEPYWSIVFNNWLQIDGDGQSDLLVNRVREDADQIELYVVRGNARVFRRRATEAKGEKAAKMAETYGVSGEAITVPQGGFVLLTRDFEAPPRIEHPLAKAVGWMIALTTPLYLPDAELAKADPGTGVLGEKKAADLAEASAIAQDAIARRDFPAAVEALQPFVGKVKKDYRAALTLGTAYKGMLLDKEAAEFLMAAGRLKRSAAEPYFLLGEMELAARHWRKALRFLEKAEEFGYRDEQVVSYYKGIAGYALQEYAGARHDLTKSLWADGTDAVTASAEAFRRKVRFDGWFDVRSGLGVVYDSNVLRAGNRHGEPLPQAIRTTKSGGYEGHAGFGLWAYRGINGHAGMRFDAQKIGWLEPTLIKVSTLKEELALDVGVYSGAGPEKDPEFELSGSGFAGTCVLGEQRAMDTVGGRGRMVVPGLAGLEVRARSQANLDPLPTRDDILDPTLGEIVPASERSNHQVYYGIELKPVRLEAWSLGVGYEGGETAMRSEFRQGESFTEQIVGVKAGLTPTTRTAIDLDLKVLLRSFAQAVDKRADKAFEVGVDWRWRFTTSLYQDFVLRYERQKSTRGDAGYVKSTAGYHLSFDL